MKTSDHKLKSIQGYAGKAIFKNLDIGSDQYVFKYLSFSNETVSDLKKEFKLSFSKDVLRFYKIQDVFYGVYISYVTFNLTYKDLYMNSVILKIIEVFEPSIISDRLDIIQLIKKDYLSSKDRSIYEVGLVLLHQNLSDLDIRLVYCDSNLPRHNAFEFQDGNTFRT